MDLDEADRKCDVMQMERTNNFNFNPKDVFNFLTTQQRNKIIISISKHLNNFDEHLGNFQLELFCISNEEFYQDFKSNFQSMEMFFFLKF